MMLICLLGMGCQNDQSKKEEQTRLLQLSADEIVGKLHYIKDPRTGLCFAYYWGGTANGGPALANVPCEAIPTNLLWTAKVQEK